MNKDTFKLIATIGLVMLLYTGVTSGLQYLFNYGLVPALRVMFDPTVFVGFWAIFTLVQDVLIIVGLIGMAVAKPSEK